MTQKTWRVPNCLFLLIIVYWTTSLIHFARIAEFVSDYPNLPIWLARAIVYFAWLAVAAVGSAGIVVLKLGRPLPGLLLIASYAVLGFAWLDHYSAAPVSAHWLVMNAIIGLEVAAAAVLLFATPSDRAAPQRTAAVDSNSSRASGFGHRLQPQE